MRSLGACWVLCIAGGCATDRGGGPSDAALDAGALAPDAGRETVPRWRPPSSCPELPPTPDGPERASDLPRGGTGISIYDVIAPPCTMYFQYHGDVEASGVYASDGTAEGVLRLGDGQLAHGAVLVGDVFVYPAGQALMRFDGTKAGTYALTDGWSLNDFGGGTEILGMGDFALFVGRDAKPGTLPVDTRTGFELMRTDGTRSGTRLVKDIVPGEWDSDIEGLTRFGDHAIFWASDGTTDGLWSTDGTEAGTQLLLRVRHAAAIGQHSTAWLDGSLFFFGEFPFGAFGLYRTDGTAAGTRFVQALDESAGHASRYRTEDGFALAAMNGEMYFVAVPLPQHGLEGETSYYGPPLAALWRSDGTPEATQLVREIMLANEPEARPDLVAIDGKLVFYVFDGATTTLWASDGTPDGTKPLREIETGPLVAAGSFAYMWTWSPEGPGRLMRTDGTDAGTFVLAEFTVPQLMCPPDVYCGSIQAPPLTAIADHVYFFSPTDAYPGGGPWVSDGTPEGTKALVPPGTQSSYASNFVELRGSAYFGAGGPDVGHALWRYRPR